MTQSSKTSCVKWRSWRGADFDSRFESKRPSKLENVIGKDLSELGQGPSGEAKEPVSAVVPLPSAEEKVSSPSAQSRSVRPGSDGGPMTMGLNISGQMELCLSFDSSGRKVKITIVDDKGLEIEVEGGAKFSLPLGGSQEKVA